MRLEERPSPPVGARRLVRTTHGWGLQVDGATTALRHDLAAVLSGAALETTGEDLGGTLLAPVDRQEVWAAGVTYERSRVARVEESGAPDVYDAVYVADRPEIFFKSTAERVVGPDGCGTIRSDSTWDVPEPELAVVLDSQGTIFGYTIGNDISSRSIEGANPLYLPQAKVWDGSCVIGPWIVLADDVEPPFDITMTISRGDDEVFHDVTSTSKMSRGFEELVSWLTRHLSFPHGAVLLTGTGMVPGDDVTLADGDEVCIEVTGIGTLRHEIRTCSP